MPPPSTISSPAVFLDRDGVLNRVLLRDGKPFPPTTLGQFEILPGVREACHLLKQAGFQLVVATNQPDVGRGTLEQEVVEAIHAHLCRELPIDRVEVNYDSGRENPPSEFRKPRPGMLLRAARELNLDLARSFMVGDRWRDIDCGHAAGCATMLIDYGYAEELRTPPDYRVKSLREAAEIILAQKDRLARNNINVNVSTKCMHNPLSNLKVQIFADGADKPGMFSLYANPLIKGLTTNPSLMKKAGVTDYEAYAKEILRTIKDKPISFEVFSDEFSEMRRQALKIAAWQSNVYVKIPITNTRGESSLPLVRELAQEGVRLNITAILTLRQVRGVAEALNPAVPSVVSVFAGRIADTGMDPEPLMRASVCLLQDQPKAELLWASVREVLNIFQADACGCHIVTVPHDVLNKAIKMVGADLGLVSLDTVKMFAQDAAAAGFSV